MKLLQVLWNGHDAAYISINILNTDAWTTTIANLFQLLRNEWTAFLPQEENYESLPLPPFPPPTVSLPLPTPVSERTTRQIRAAWWEERERRRLGTAQRTDREMWHPSKQYRDEVQPLSLLLLSLSVSARECREVDVGRLSYGWLWQHQCQSMNPYAHWMVCSDDELSRSETNFISEMLELCYIFEN